MLACLRLFHFFISLSHGFFCHTLAFFSQPVHVRIISFMKTGASLKKNIVCSNKNKKVEVLPLLRSMFPHSDSNNTYYLSHFRLPVFAAIAACQEWPGGELAMIQSEDDEKTVAWSIRQGMAEGREHQRWIGGTTMDEVGQF